MANIGQICYDVQGYNNPSNVDLTKELVPSGSKIVKLGIQAPTGSVVSLNGNSIKIGRTGIYELADGIEITSMYFTNVAGSGVIIDYFFEDI